MTVVALALVLGPMRTGNGKSSMLRVAAAVVVPTVALGLYAYLGTPNAVSRDHSPANANTVPSAGPATAATSAGQKKVGSVASLLDGLRERVEKDPDDAGNWLLLARSYEHLGRTEEAASAFEQARRLGRTDAFPAAMQTSAPKAQQAALRGTLAASDQAMSQIQPGDVIFIFAKQSQDQRMPLAALRRSAANLPLEFSMGDAQAMLPGTKLADYETLYVTASISRTGMATESVEGLTSSGAVVKLSSPEPIAIRIETNAEQSARGQESP